MKVIKIIKTNQQEYLKLFSNHYFKLDKTTFITIIDKKLYSENNDKINELLSKKIIIFKK